MGWTCLDTPRNYAVPRRMILMFALQLVAAALLIIASAAILRFLWLADQSPALDARSAVGAKARKPVALNRAA